MRKKRKNEEKNLSSVSFHQFREHVLGHVFGDYYRALIDHIFFLNLRFEFELFQVFDQIHFSHFRQSLNVELNLILKNKNFYLFFLIKGEFHLHEFVIFVHQLNDLFVNQVALEELYFLLRQDKLVV
jgi:hypothetical protein